MLSCWKTSISAGKAAGKPGEAGARQWERTSQPAQVAGWKLGITLTWEVALAKDVFLGWSVKSLVLSIPFQRRGSTCSTVWTTTSETSISWRLKFVMQTGNNKVIYYPGIQHVRKKCRQKVGRYHEGLKGTLQVLKDVPVLVYAVCVCVCV